MSKVMDIRERVFKWATKVGEAEAIVKLMACGLSHSTARRLVKGLCKSEPSELVSRAVESAIAS